MASSNADQTMTATGRMFWVNLILLSLPVWLIGFLGYQRRWISEDAFITLRVVHNVLAGHGPVFNVGERVEVYTHPIWAGMLVLWGWPGLPLEEGAVYLGLVCTMAGMAFGLAGAVTIWRQTGIESTPSANTSRILLPLGGLVFVAIPPVWDFASSGLETGLAIAWLGISFWLLVRELVVQTRSSRPYLTATILGLGLLVRPELFIYTTAFITVLLIVELADRSGRSRAIRGIGIIAAAALVPMLYQIFRMGYFAALTPNTAIAKEAGRSNWPQGLRYLGDFVDPYWLWVPLTLLATWLGWQLYELTKKNRYRLIAVLLAPVVAALVHVLYVIRLGGDFMHARMLLPALFALLLPVLAVPVSLPTRHDNRMAVKLTWLLSGAVLLWVVVCGFWLRWPDGARISDDGIADERAVYVDLTGHSNPVTLEDYAEMQLGWTSNGQRFQSLAESSSRLLLLPEDDAYPLRGSVNPEIALVAVVGNIGVTGMAAGDRVHLVDFQGIGDPVGSRMEIVERGRPGHEKFMPPFWARARFEDETSLLEADPIIQDARAVLQCGDTSKLLEAIEKPLTPARFIQNILLSPRLTALRINPDPTLQLATRQCEPVD